MQADGRGGHVKFDAFEHFVECNTGGCPRFAFCGRFCNLREQAAEQITHVLRADLLRVLHLIAARAQIRQLVDQAGSRVLQILHAAQHRCRVVQASCRVDCAADLLRQRTHFALQPRNAPAIDWPIAAGEFAHAVEK